ncbi:Carbohydrate-selective porin [Parelusimicrobium proximum]|uniref:carbohydrate porin n=1 Tax=Parelusimicrobium proximum TaxID=3228953 RepID=UPI003D181C98
MKIFRAVPIASLLVFAFAFPLFAGGAGVLNKYDSFKETVLERYGISFGGSISLMPQRLAPSGRQTSLQTMYFPYLEWTVFDSGRYGSGSFYISDIFTHYWGAQALALEERSLVASGINDYPENANLFYNLTYTHTLPAPLDWISVTAGQYSLFDFDGGTYTNDQQTALINFALSQNASALYPWAGLGAYVSVKPSETVEIAGGYQDASNIEAKNIRAKTAFGGEYLGFGYLSFSPEVLGLGGQYSFLFYHQPSVEEQEGSSLGWSLNIEQSVSEKMTLFARASGADNTPHYIKQSYALGAAYKNPFNRNGLDTIIIGAAYNKLAVNNLDDYEGVRSGETVVEAAWIWGVGNHFTITPDIQMYPRAGLKSGGGWVFAPSLRLSVLL